MKKAILTITLFCMSFSYASDRRRFKYEPSFRLHQQQKEGIDKRMNSSLYRLQLKDAIVQQNINKIRDLIPLADITRQHDNEKPSLHIAIESNNPEIVQLLINARVPLNERDQLRRTALNYAIQLGNPDIIELLKRAGAPQF